MSREDDGATCQHAPTLWHEGCVEVPVVKAFEPTEQVLLAIFLLPMALAGLLYAFA